jgi:hypothetical protein
MIQSIQVLRFHLLELEKVQYLIYSSEIGEQEEYTYPLGASPK